MATRRRTNSRTGALLLVSGLTAVLTAGVGLLVVSLLIEPSPSSPSSPSMVP